ncbi:MAG: ABC transporter ATP-binding protein [Eubacteriales bacterium]|nr:ABC transporter ATP-binding protein [Eubacteriales bacterium]
MKEPMLKLDQVSKFYAQNGIVTSGFSKVSLEFRLGEFAAITGESGSGKSTLLNVISGLDSYEEGEMYIFGQPTSGYGAEDMEQYRKRYIGNIFQTFNLINNYTVYQNVELVLLLAGYRKEEIRPRVEEIIDAVGLTKYRNTKASRLSGGQKQRVAIARALAKETPIIVADEPTGNLDIESAKSIIRLLADLSRDKLIIIVTHNYEQVAPYVTRKITMHDGKIIEDRRLSAPAEQMSSNAAEESAEPLSSKSEGAPAEPLFSDEKKAIAEPTFSNEKEPPAGSVSSDQKEVPGSGHAQNSIELSAGDFLSQLGVSTENNGARGPKQSAGLKPASSTVQEEKPPVRPSSRRRNPGEEPHLPRFREARTGSLSAWDTIRLGIRNTFSLPAKLFLLLLVFLFLTVGTFSAYSSYRNNVKTSAESQIYNSTFTDSDPSRLVVLKKDNTAFTKEEIAAIRQMKNVRSVDTRDILLDDTFSLTESGKTSSEDNSDSAEDDSFSTSVWLRGMEYVKKGVTDGREPEASNEAVLLYYSEGNSYGGYSRSMAKELLNKEYTLSCDTNGLSLADGYAATVKIVGLAKMPSSLEDNSKMSTYASAVVCTGDEVLDQARLLALSSYAVIEADANGTTVQIGTSENSQFPIISSDRVPKGQVLIPDTLAMYYANGAAAGKPLNVTVTREKQKKYISFSVAKVYTESNYRSVTGYTGKFADMPQGIYMNPADVPVIYESDTFQISVLVKDQDAIGETESRLKSAGYSPLNVVKAASYKNQSIRKIQNALKAVVLVLLLTALFFIVYFIIRLIFKSQNIYFSTIRMLGGSRKNCAGLLLTDMLAVFHLAFGICLALLLLIRSGRISFGDSVDRMARFIAGRDMLVLYFIVLGLSILLALRYASKIFGKTAMNAYKEEV